MDDAARTELLLEVGIFRIVGILRFLLGIQMIQVAEKLIETVHRRQHLVAVAEVVLAELTRQIALSSEQSGDGRVFLLHAFGCPGQADFGEAGANGGLPGDEGGPAGGAALLTVPVGEQRTAQSNAVDIGRLVAHHATIVGAEVELADVIAPDHEDVGLLVGGVCGQQDDEG